MARLVPRLSLKVQLMPPRRRRSSTDPDQLDLLNIPEATAVMLTYSGRTLDLESPDFSRFDIEEIEIADDSPTMILATATIPPGEPQELTLNLAAPIIINGATMKAKQVILSDDAYTVKHRVFASTDRVAEKAA